MTMTLKDYPILRLAIPLATGTFFARKFHPYLSMEWTCGSIIVLMLFISVFLWLHNFRYRWCFGAFVFLLFFGLGAFRMIYQWDKINVNWPEGEHDYVATVMEPPIEKPKSIWCKVALYEGQNAYLYLAKDSFAYNVTMGDGLMFHTRMRRPGNEGLPFDYASYLLCKGISGTAYVPSGYWKRMSCTGTLSFKQKAMAVREKIVHQYREWGIGEKQLPILSALTVGYKTDLSDEVRDTYSVAGISHVLALSGMHIGFGWLMMGVLLKPLDRKGLRWIKWSLSSVLLWAFAFISGLEASVVRAVIMCMMMEFGHLLGGKSLSMNTLSIAAFFMLMYNPCYLYEVGFQLSFLAVLSILLFYHRFYALCPFQHPLFRSVWGVMSVSMAAQLGTAPLVMYYFSNFSVYFLLANLGVALLVPCIIYTAFASMVLVYLPCLQRWLVMVLNKMVEMLNSFAGWISELPYASLSVINLHQVEVWGVYLLLGLAWWYSVVRKRRIFIALLATMAGWLALHCCLILK